MGKKSRELATGMDESSRVKRGVDEKKKELQEKLNNLTIRFMDNPSFKEGVIKGFRDRMREEGYDCSKCKFYCVDFDGGLDKCVLSGEDIKDLSMVCLEFEKK